MAKSRMQPPPIPSDATGSHWEYKVVMLKHWERELAEEELNQLGLEHWELVGMGLTWLGRGRLVFKRRYVPPRRSF